MFNFHIQRCFIFLNVMRMPIRMRELLFLFTFYFSLKVMLAQNRVHIHTENMFGTSIIAVSHPLSKELKIFKVFFNIYVEI